VCVQRVVDDRIAWHAAWVTTWRRIRRITVAGQAEIWLARDADSGDEAVMKKLLPTAQLHDPDAELRRFAREVRCQSAMDNPGIMPILGHNFSDNPPWYVMPQADRSLEDVIGDHPSGMPISDAAAIVLDVADAVEYAHQQGVLHRDLKPANILEVDGKWVVADFGLCRDLSSDSTTFTRSNTVVGTVAYMAPEQFDNAHAVGPAADVHALGRVLYHMLTGRVPFPYAPLEHVPAEFQYVIAKAMAEDPADRYATVAEFAREVEMIAGRSDSLTPPAERGQRLLASAMAGDRKATGDLLALILANAMDEVFYNQIVAKLPPPMLASLQSLNPSAFAEMVRTYDKFSEGGHPFNHVDVIADFFANVFSTATDPRLRELALRRIMVVGASHNRFYAGEVFARLIGSLSNPNDILMATNVMRADPEDARWYREYLKSYSLPPSIRDFLDGAA
jgi:serine/threonine protein kinase